MMEKKRMAALLAAVLFGMSAIPAGAVNLIDTDAAATDSAEHAELDLYGVRATVTDRQDGELTVSTETAGTVVVHIAEQTIIMDTQTGLPAGAPGDKTPNWFVSTVSWPDFDGFSYMKEGVKYQWETAAAWWKETCRIAKENGVKRIAIEEFPGALVHNVRTFNKLCEVVGEDSDVLGLNLDPSHLMIQGAEPIAAARALGDKIFYVHGKDARPERYNVDVDGLLENLPVECSKDRTWNYVAVGCGRDLQWWKEFFSVCRMMGYNGYVSLEMEDLTMSVEAGLETSIDALKATISK